MHYYYIAGKDNVNTSFSQMPVFMLMSQFCQTINDHTTQALCSSRKYPYPPPTEGFFVLTPHPLGISVPEGFVKTPPPLWNFCFFFTLISELLGSSKSF